MPVPSSAGRRGTDQVARLRQLATLLDGAVGIPGTKFRLGLDALLGVIPGVGDLVGGVLSLFIVVSAIRLGVPKAVVGRMIANVALDTAVGTIPVLGDLFDAGFKSNLRNVSLIDEYVAAPATLERRSRWVLIGFTLLAGLALVGAIAAIVALVRLVGQAVG